MKNSLLTITLFLLLLGCSSQGSKQETSNKDSDVSANKTTADEQIVNINNSLFSIPSPHQISKILIEEKIVPDNRILNPANNVRQYNNSFKKALNIGVYGADLGYVNMYNQTQEAITYFSVIKALSEELNLNNAIKKETFERIEKNISNQDSLISLITASYQDIDIFLKTNRQENTGALILTGGWVESMYILSKFITRHRSNQELVKRLCENKNALTNLIKILSQFADHNKIYETLIEQLIELENIFMQVEVNYAFERTETYIDQKTTKIFSTATMNISEDILKELTETLEQIRTFVIS